MVISEGWFPSLRDPRLKGTEVNAGGKMVITLKKC